MRVCYLVYINAILYLIVQLNNKKPDAFILNNVNINVIFLKFHILYTIAIDVKQSIK